MNWQRGLLRVWVVLSLLWIAYGVVQAWTPLGCWTGFSAGPWCRYVYAQPATLAAIILGPPIVLWMAGAIVIWVLRGFSKPR
jgi:hypothetical protein